MRVSDTEDAPEAGRWFIMKSKKLTAGAVLLVLFLILIVLIKTVDVQPVGPENSQIGLAAINTSFHNLTGLQMALYKVTQVTGYLAILSVVIFGLWGVWQLIQRKSIARMDKDILLLGGLYAALAVCYLFFEKCIINYRPVIMDEGLEASFPSSHTMLAMCLMLAAMEQLRRRLKDQPLGRILSMVCAVLLAVTVIGRLLSGVHWLTDILGGLLLGGALYLFYAGLIDLLRQRGRI